MKKLFALIFLLFPLLASGQAKKLIWSEEFNYNGLPDTTKWTYEKGFVRNREPQFYTWDRKENARVQDGNLIITAIKEEYNGSKYTSASITTNAYNLSIIYTL